MKRLYAIVLVLCSIFLYAVIAQAGMVTLVSGITSDVATPTLLCAECKDEYLLTYDINTTLDDIVVLTVYSRLGTPLQAITTSAATTGEANRFTVSWKLRGAETYTITGIGSGACSVDVYTTN